MSLKEDPPDPGGGKCSLNMDIVQPPSPAAFCIASSELRRKRRSNNSTVARNVRPRSGSESSNDTLTCSDTEDTIFQPGQCSPPNSFSTSNSKITLSDTSPPVRDASIPPSVPQTAQTPIGRQMYGSLDRGPFTVHVQRLEPSPSAGTSLHPVTFGRFLFSRSSEFQGVKDGSIKSVGRNRIALDFTSAQTANNFIKSPSLSSNNFRAFIPTFNITRMGIVRGIPVDMSPEEIMTEVICPSGCGYVIKARRMNFKVVLDGVVSWKPSQTVVLTFDGQILPSKVYLGYNALPVALYTYPTIMCYQCCRYGHTKNQCRSKPACYKCSSDHSGDTCKVDEGNAKCLWCKNNHFAINKCCPEMKRQNNIKAFMSENCISYSEASKQCQVPKMSFAEVVSNASPLPRPSKNLNIEPSKIHYKKKVSRLSPTPVSAGYDHTAHSNIIRGDFSEAAPNGCAFINPNTKEELPSVQSVITELLKLLNLLSTLCNPPSSPPNVQPSNAAFNLNSLISLLNNGSLRKDPTVELS